MSSIIADKKQLPMKYIKHIIWTLLSLALLTTCSDNIDTDEGDEEIRMINTWISDVMNEVYYWNESIPSDLEADGVTDPEEFFEEHLYDDEDVWSWMSTDYTSLEAELDGEPTSMGYSPYFALVSDDQVIIIVEYVYPDSPAEEAGLERGDVIYAIDGEYMTTDDYYDLYSGTSYTASLGYIAEESGTYTIYYTYTTVSLTAEVIEADPLIYSDIIEESDIKIGYMVYTGFTSGDDDKYLTTLGETLTDFAQQGIDELIVDLRYNPGGEISAAQFLTSALAPVEVVNNEEILINLDYNQLYNDYFEKNSPEDLYYTFEPNNYNIDLDKVYFLTAWGTASASELTIVGLEPYMDVITIGEYTYGKYTGMWVIPDTETPARHDYALVPIVMKYENSVGYGNFYNGLTPDYEVDDDGMFLGVPFGDLDDPIIATAVDLITGNTKNAKSSTVKKEFAGKRIIPNQEELRMNLFVPTKFTK